MLMCFEKKIENIEEISKILLTILKVFKKNLEVLEKMYTIKYAFHCIPLFFSKKNTTLIVYITEFFLKSRGGAKCITAPPPSKIWGGPWPPGPPVADPMH